MQGFVVGDDRSNQVVVDNPVVIRATYCAYWQGTGGIQVNGLGIQSAIGKLGKVRILIDDVDV